MAHLAARHQVQAVRSFNRFYTRRIGVLDEGLLHSSFTLTEARVVFELAQRKQMTAKEIADVLELDAGYLSRILSRFARNGLISKKRSSHDSRSVELSLTAKGRKSFKQLDRSSHASTAGMLAGLRASDRQRLLASLNEVERTLGGSASAQVEDVVLRMHRVGDIGWAIERHGQLYAEEFGWNVAFEALVAKLFADFAMNHDQKCERLWIAEIRGERVGCVFVVRNADDPSVAQLRCLLVDPKGRGKGVGRRLVQECLAFSRAAGYKKIVLWTNDVLVSARRIYEAEGFTLIKSERHRDFGPKLTGQTWSLDL